MISVLAMLDPPQINLVERLSQMLYRDQSSSDYDDQNCHTTIGQAQVEKILTQNRGSGDKSLTNLAKVLYKPPKKKQVKPYSIVLVE